MRRVFADPEPILDEVELIILAVPDDAIAAAGRLAPDVRRPGDDPHERRPRGGGPRAGDGAPARRSARSTRSSRSPTPNGRSPRSTVRPSRSRATTSWRRCWPTWPRRSAPRPVRLAPGSKPAYHAAAVLAAGGFVALLDAIAELGRVAGLDEAGSLAIYGPLIEETLGNARALGIRAALTGPMTRGDVGTLAAHLETLRAHAPGVARALRRRGSPRDRPGRGAWRAGTGGRGDDATVVDSALQGRPEPVP